MSKSEIIMLTCWVQLDVDINKSHGDMDKSHVDMDKLHVKTKKSHIQYVTVVALIFIQF